MLISVVFAWRQYTFLHQILIYHTLNFTYSCIHGYVTTQFLYIGARDCEPYGCRKKDSRGKKLTVVNIACAKLEIFVLCYMS